MCVLILELTEKIWQAYRRHSGSWIERVNQYRPLDGFRPVWVPQSDSQPLLGCKSHRNLQIALVIHVDENIHGISCTFPGNPIVIQKPRITKQTVRRLKRAAASFAVVIYRFTARTEKRMEVPMFVSGIEAVSRHISTLPTLFPVHGKDVFAAAEKRFI
jgi:hypothetical protein